MFYFNYYFIYVVNNNKIYIMCYYENALRNALKNVFLNVLY